MIRFAIVEDEEKQIELLRGYLNRFSEENGEPVSIRCFSDGYAIADHYTSDYDIILMDIEMGLMNGMEAAEEIRKTDEEVVIIFITNMAQYAIRGYSVDALDYVLKPVSYAALEQSLKRAMRHVKRSEETYVVVSEREHTQKLRAKDILWIESQGHRLTFHTEQGNYETTTYSMKKMEEKLSGDGFLRCNSGCLVNLDRVKGIQGGCIEVGNDLLTVARGRKAEFMSALVSRMTR